MHKLCPSSTLSISLSLAQACRCRVQAGAAASGCPGGCGGSAGAPAAAAASLCAQAAAAELPCGGRHRCAAGFLPHTYHALLPGRFPRAASRAGPGQRCSCLAVLLHPIPGQCGGAHAVLCPDLPPHPVLSCLEWQCLGAASATGQCLHRHGCRGILQTQRACFNRLQRLHSTHQLLHCCRPCYWLYGPWWPGRLSSRTYQWPRAMLAHSWQLCAWSLPGELGCSLVCSHGLTHVCACSVSRAGIIIDSLAPHAGAGWRCG